MKHQYTRFKFGLILPLAMCFFFAACNNDPSDEEINKNIADKLSSNTNNNIDNNKRFSKIQAETSEGVVTLNGECEGQNCADSAATIVRNIEGVKEVVNNIKETAPDTDFTLRTSVQTIISKYTGVQADVAAGVVVLRGEIERSQLQPLMNELGALNPKKIDNQLAVK